MSGKPTKKLAIPLQKAGLGLFTVSKTIKRHFARTIEDELERLVSKAVTFLRCSIVDFNLPLDRVAAPHFEHRREITVS